MRGNILCLINRTSHQLKYTKDGRDYTLEPGENYVNSDHVRFARVQNPIMGTRDPYTLQSQFLVGIKGKDDCSEIPDEVLAMLPKEVLDRSLMPGDLQKVVERRTGFPTRGRIGVEAPSVGMIDPGTVPANAR